MEINSTKGAKRGEQLVKSSIILSFGTFLPKFLAMFSLPIITANLTKSEFGTYDLICILETLFLPCVTLQIHTAAFRFLIESRKEEKQTNIIITNVVFFILITSFIALAVLCLCLHQCSVILRLLICGFFFFDILKTAAQQIARGVNQNIKYSISAIIHSVINLVLVVSCVGIFGMRLEGVVVALMVSSAMSLLFLSLKLNLFDRISIAYLSKDQIIAMIKFSWPMIPNSLSLWAMNLSNRLILTFFLGLEANAIFAVANKIPSLFSVVQSTFTLAWQENASIASEDKDSGSYYSKMFDAFFSLMVGVMALLVCATPILFYILIKGDYAEAYYHMPILFLGVFYNVIVAFLGGIYVAKKATKSVGITTMISAALCVVLNLSFIKFIGIYAASISMVISYVFLALYRMRDIKRYVEMTFDWRKIGICTLLLSLMCLMCFLQNMLLNMVNIILAIAVAYSLNKTLIKNLAKLVINKINNK